VLEDAEQWRHISCWIDQLEEKQAAAIRGAFFDGSTYAELALRQGVPLATMKSWVRRGLTALKHAGTTMADENERPAPFSDMIGNAVTRIEGR
jgi:DNA-directed RNA polymerase specialized sigma24 family protein